MGIKLQSFYLWGLNNLFMVFNRRMILYLLIGLLLSTCTTEVELEGSWRDIPIVHGFLSRQDTAHYLRVEKAFLPVDGDAREVAQLADSLYYDDAVVQIEKLQTGEVFTLQRVDGNLEGYPRDDGPFATAPNYLYKIHASEIGLEEGETVRLLLNRSDKLPVVTAETAVLEDLAPRATSPSSPINMDYTRQVNFSWSAGVNARIFDVRLQIYYRESLPENSSEFVMRQVEWVLDDELGREGDLERVTFSFPGEEFYVFLSQNIPVRDDVIRIFDHLDFEIIAAGQELVDLLRVSNANLGITSFQSVPVYSNLSEGRGIFSSRAIASRRGLTLNSPSLDSLRNGKHTEKLNFR
jgi:hypothetical protein